VVVTAAKQRSSSHDLAAILLGVDFSIAHARPQLEYVQLEVWSIFITKKKSFTVRLRS
jgi:hypothetical protein